MVQRGAHRFELAMLDVAIRMKDKLSANTTHRRNLTGRSLAKALRQVKAFQKYLRIVVLSMAKHLSRRGRFFTAFRMTKAVDF
jgi:IS1 family transposase